MGSSEITAIVYELLVDEVALCDFCINLCVDVTWLLFIVRHMNDVSVYVLVSY